MTTPSWAEAIRRTVQRTILALHTAMPGRVVAYDATNQTADVQPLLKWADALPGQVRSVFDLPVIPDVLVCHPGAGALGVHLPVTTDSLVLLVFCSRSLTTWRAGSANRVADPGQIYTPTPLSGALALPLMRHDSAPWSGDLTDSGTVNLGESGDTMDFPALAQLVLDRLNGIKTDFDAHTHNYLPGPGSATPTTGPAAPMGSPSSVAAAKVKVS
jgi:hypothetical protein